MLTIVKQQDGSESIRPKQINEMDAQNAQISGLHISIKSSSKISPFA